MQSQPVRDRIAGLIFENIREGVFAVDRDCRVVAVNPAAERIIGVPRHEALGRRCHEVMHSDLCAAACPLHRSMQDGKPRERVRLPILTRDGRRVPVSVNTAVLRDDEGQVVGGVEFIRDRSDVDTLERRLHHATGVGKMVSVSREMQRIFTMLPDVAQSECNALITGPSGSGKELIAQALHDLSPRRSAPYLKINCGALPETLLESELFGYEQGAFTDAKRSKPGQFALARGGTLLLDEIGEMPTPLQVKILRVLSAGEYSPLGSVEVKKADARILASTNRELEACVAEGSFREDLYYRINVVNITMPSLQERMEDIPLLVDHFIARLREKRGREIAGISPEALRALRCYEWPGNVRELENAIEHAFVMCHHDTIEPRHLPERILHAASRPVQALRESRSERAVIAEVLERHGGNRRETAEELGMHRTTLWRKIQQYDLD